MKMILVPTDFSPQAEYALQAAHQLAKLLKASMHVVYVLEFPLSIAKVEILPTGYIPQVKQELEKQLQQLVEQNGIHDLPVRCQVRVGNPYRSITSALLEKPADLVVMGSKGASGIDEVLIGSNAERMVRFAPCPVLVIKDKTDLSSIDNIVYATALQDEESKVIKALRTLQHAYDAQLHVVKINTLSNFLDDPTGMKQLRAWAKTHHLKNYTLNTFSDIREEEGIIHFAQEVQADLIALATHGRRGLMHLLGGSIAEDVVNHAPCPIWTMSLHPHSP